MCEEEEMHKGTKRLSQCCMIIYEYHFPKFKDFVIFLFLLLLFVFEASLTM